MYIHEWQAKEQLSGYGAPILRGYLACDINEAENVIGNFSGERMVIKAQVHAGGRGKAGGVKLANTKNEAYEYARNMFGMKIVNKQTGLSGKTVSKVYIEDVVNIKKEYYLSLIIDRETSELCFIVSRAGGMEIEEVAERDPDSILKVVVNSFYGLQNFHVRKIALFLDDDSKDKNSFIKSHEKFSALNQIVRAIYNCFLDKDASQIEINPLVETEDDDGNFNGLFLLDAKMNFDDSALYKHKEIEDLFDPDEVNDLEIQAAKFHLNYIKLDSGKIGCMVNGAGLAMATMDMIKYYGSEPANFLDVGGGATKDRVMEALKIILSDVNVKGILINIFGGIVKCDMIAEAIVEAAREIDVKIPLVVRLSGTNFEEGNKILEKSGINLISSSDLRDAAENIVRVTKDL